MVDLPRRTPQRKDFTCNFNQSSVALPTCSTEWPKNSKTSPDSGLLISDSLLTSNRKKHLTGDYFLLFKIYIVQRNFENFHYQLCWKTLPLFLIFKQSDFKTYKTNIDINIQSFGTCASNVLSKPFNLANRGDLWVRSDQKSDEGQTVCDQGTVVQLR